MTVEKTNIRKLTQELLEGNIENILVEVKREGKDLILPSAVAAMFAPDEAGRLHRKVDTAGEVTESNAAQISQDQARLRWESRSTKPSWGGPSDDETASWRHEPKIGLLGAIELIVGTKADHALLATLAGYKGCLDLLALWSDTSDTYSFAFQDEDNVAVVGVPTSMSFALTAGIPVSLFGIKLRGNTANKAIEVDVSGGAAGEKLHIVYIGHYEDV